MIITNPNTVSIEYMLEISANFIFILSYNII
jgi:hypothetical protein